MQCKAPDKGFFAEIRDLNLGFLNLLTDPRAAPAGLELLGIPDESVQAIGALAPPERRRLARTPALLARLEGLPPAWQVAERQPPPAGLDPDWRQAAGLFAIGLLTYLWQLARHQPAAAALCLGPEPERVQSLARLRCRDILSSPMVAAASLRGRRILSPLLLPGLLSEARRPAADDDMLGLQLIPLGLAGLRPSDSRSRGC